MSGSELCFSTLRSGAFLILNRNLLKKLGPNEATILSLLIDKAYYHYTEGNLTQDGFFYETIQNLERKTLLSKDEQNTVLKGLVAKGLIEVKLAGIPARRHFKILFDSVNSLVIEQTDNDGSVCRKPANLNNPVTSVIASDENSGGSVCRNPANLFAGKSQTIIKTDNENKPASVTSLNGVQPTKLVEPRIKKRETPLVIIPESPYKQKVLASKPIIRVRKKLKHPPVTDKIMEIIDHWKSKGFKKAISREDSNEYAILITYLDELLKGTLFSGFRNRKDCIRKYSMSEIKRSIDNFAVCTFDKDYLPVNKSSIQDMALQSFLYRRFEPREERKSNFLFYLENNPRRAYEAKTLTPIDKLPYVTKILDSWFLGKFPSCNGNYRKSDVVLASKSLEKFYEENKPRLRIEGEPMRMFGIQEPISFLAKQLTRMLDKTLRENEGLYTIMNSAWLKSEKTMTERLPAFLKSEDMMR
jgi:hypothetical protein